jgi:hypothetical protein
MSRKKRHSKDGDFRNHWKEVSSTPWQRFQTCSFVELFEHRVLCWRLSSKVQAIMRLYYPAGDVKEFVIGHREDINQTIRSVLNYDPNIKIFIVNPMQQLFIHATDSDDDATPPKNPVSV